MIDDKLEKSFEGLRLTAYPDPATGGEPWTIGYGHTGGVRPGDTCTAAQAETWLLSDMRSAIGSVSSLVKTPLTGPQESALVDFVYNVGAGNFSHSTLLRLLNAGDYAGAASHIDDWDHANGKVMAGLLRRRQAETDLFREGTAS